MNYLTVGVLAFAVSYFGVAAIRVIALRRNLLDIPNERSSHRVPTPRGGGLAIAAIVLGGFALTSFWASGLTLRMLIGYLLGALIVAAISGIDDLLGVSPKARLLIHLLAAAVFIAVTGFVNRIYIPFVGELDWSWLGIPIALFWIAGLTNAYNFMDGIDGIAAGQAIVASAFWFIVTLAFGLDAFAALSMLIVGASLGFLPHNTPPARIFMGDVGSTTLGYTFAVLPILAFVQTDNARSLIAGVLCVAPFVFDAALTMLRRLLHRENVMQAHRSHLYQRLVKLGYPHGRVSLLYVGLATFSSLMAVLYLWGDDLANILAMLAVVCLLLAQAVGVTRLERRASPLRGEAAA